MFNLASGAFGGSEIEIDDDVLAQVIESLFRAGARVGFVGSHKHAWRPLAGVADLPPEAAAAQVIRDWRANPRDFDALAFVFREGGVDA
jgi:hypothetical protein